MKIDSYTTGSRMTIDGRSYDRDLKVVDGRIKDNWWRKQGHRLTAADIEDILSAQPEVLVVGTGYAGNLRIPEATRERLSERRIQVVARQTAEAVEEFNRLAEKGKDVAGAFHLTC